jgi:hypothetical protein
VEQIQILSHNFMIPKQVEIWLGDLPIASGSNKDQFSPRGKLWPLEGNVDPLEILTFTPRGDLFPMEGNVDPLPRC